MEEGRISRSGSFQELIAQGDQFSNFLQTRLNKEVKTLHADNPTQNSDSFAPLTSGNRLVQRTLSRPAVLTEADLWGQTQTLAATEKQPETKTLTAESKSTTAEVAAGNSTNWRSCFTMVGPATVKVVAMIVLTNAISTVLSVGASVWLSKWTQENQTMVNGEQDAALRDYRLTYYGLFGLGQGNLLKTSQLKFIKQ